MHHPQDAAPGHLWGRGQGCSKSLCNIKREYNRKFRRTRQVEATQKLVDYPTHGAY